MDISLNRVAVQVTSTTNKKSAGNADAAPAANPPADDVVDSSSPNLKVNDLKASALAAPGIDMEKVQRIANAIQNGQYTIDANKIAEKMIASEFDTR